MKLAIILLAIVVTGFIAFMFTNTVNSYFFSKDEYFIQISAGTMKQGYKEKRGGIFTIIKCTACFSMLRIYTALHLFKMKIL